MGKLTRCIFYALAVLIICYAVLLSLARVIVPQLGHQLPFYEAWVSQTLHEPVRIKNVQAFWSGFGPEMHFDHVVVYKHANHQPLFKIGHLSIGVNVWLSLLEWRLVPSKLTISDTHIDVYQNQQGELQITGMPKLAHHAHRYKGKLMYLLFWLLTEADIRVHHVSVELHNVHGVTINLKDVNLRVMNNLMQHRLAARANIAGKKSASVHLIADVQGRSFTDKQLRAQLYLQLQHMQLPWLHGSLQTWLQLQRLHHGFKVHVNALNANMTLTALYSHPLKIGYLQGSLNWQPLAQGWSAQCQDFYWTDGNVQQRGQWALTKQGKQPLQLHLLTRIRLRHVANLRDYVPQRHISPILSHWLRMAFRAGAVPDAEMVIEGSHEQVWAHGRDVSLRYDPAWPQLTHSDAVLRLRDHVMTISANHAAVMGAHLSHVTALIPNLRYPQLLISGQADGAMSQGIAFLQHSPLPFASNFANVSVSGLFHLFLHLTVCLYCNTVTVHSQGVVHLDHASLTLPRWQLPLTQLQGALSFVDQDLQASQISGRLFDKPMQMQISTAVQPANRSVLRISLSSVLGVNELSHLLPTIAHYLHGESPFEILLQLRNDTNPLGNDVTLASTLRGIAISHVPASLAKQAAQSCLSRIKLQLKHQAITSVAVHYANKLSLIARLNHAYWQVQAWSHSLTGRLTLSQDLRSSWQGHLQQLRLPKLSSYLANSGHWQVPSMLPNIHLSISQLYYANKPLGSLSLITKNHGQTLNISHLRLRLPEHYDIDVSGGWHYAGKNHTQLRGWIMTPNISAILDQIGYVKTLSGGNGYVQAALRWQGAPWQLNVKTLRGSIGWKLKDGHVLKISQSAQDALGFAKLLNILSVQSLMENISNSVSGQSDKGFPFSDFEAVMQIAKGRAQLQQFDLDGPVAAVKIAGSVGLLRHNYQLQLAVYPHLTSSAPLIAGILGGPIAAVVAWAANKVVEPAVGAIAAYHYRVAGSWKHPEIKKVEQKT